MTLFVDLTPNTYFSTCRIISIALRNLPKELVEYCITLI